MIWHKGDGFLELGINHKARSYCARLCLEWYKTVYKQQRRPKCTPGQHNYVSAAHMLHSRSLLQESNVGDMRPDVLHFKLSTAMLHGSRQLVEPWTEVGA